MDEKKAQACVLTVKDSILVGCISFTAVAVVLSLLACLSAELTMEMTHRAYLQLFVCTALISSSMYFTGRIRTDSRITASFIGLLNVVIVIFGVGGGVFRWFPWEPKYIAEVTAVIAVVFTATNGMMVWQDKELAKAINKKIKERGDNRNLA